DVVEDRLADDQVAGLNVPGSEGARNQLGGAVAPQKNEAALGLREYPEEGRQDGFQDTLQVAGVGKLLPDFEEGPELGLGPGAREVFTGGLRGLEHIQDRRPVLILGADLDEGVREAKQAIGDLDQVAVAEANGTPGSLPIDPRVRRVVDVLEEIATR